MTDGGRSDRLKERDTSNMFIFFQGEGNRKWWSSQREEKCNSNMQVGLWRLLDNKHCTDFSPLCRLTAHQLSVSQKRRQTAGHDFISDIHCHKWFSLWLTSCHSHYCPLWERHAHTDQVTHTMAEWQIIYMKTGTDNEIIVKTQTVDYSEELYG